MHLVNGSTISLDAGYKCYPNADSIGNRLEEQYTKEVLDLVIERLNALGYEAIDCTPWNEKFNFIGDSLSYRVRNINKLNSSLHLEFSFHLHHKKAIECWVSGYGKAFKFAEKILKEVSTLNYYDRGVKLGENYLISHNNMPTIIIRLFFEESIERCRKDELNAIATNIVNAITSE